MNSPICFNPPLRQYICPISTSHPPLHRHVALSAELMHIDIGYHYIRDGAVREGNTSIVRIKPDGQPAEDARKKAPS